MEENSVKNIIALARRGMGRRSISKELGVSEWRVRKILDDHPCDTEKSATDRLRQQIDLAEYKKLKKRKTFFELVGEELLRAVKTIPPKAPPRDTLRFRRKFEPEEMGFLMSDSHIGLNVDQRESGGLGSYNVEIFLERLAFLKVSLKQIFEIHLVNTPYPALNLFFLGDIVDGAAIYPGHARQLDMHAMDQVVEAINGIGELISWLAGLYPWSVNCHCVVGNHGRIGGKGEESPLNNFDFLCYVLLERELAKHDNVRFNISRSWWMIVERMGFRFYCAHGDDVRSWMGVPYYGLERFLSRVQQMVGHFDADFDYILSGHFHRPANIGKILLNGAWPGGTEYSIKQLQSAVAPVQKLFSIHPTFGITWERNIQLQDPAKRAQIKIFK